MYRCGDITEWVKIATLVETYNLSMASHAGDRVSATIVAAVPNGLIVESFDRSQYREPDDPVEVPAGDGHELI